MLPSIPRKFTLIDAMVLIVAAAVAMIPIRFFLWEHWRFTEDWSSAQVLRLAFLVDCLLEPAAVTLSLALLMLRLRKPRPRLRRVFRQPGTAACTATIVYACLASISFLISLVMGDTMNKTNRYFLYKVDTSFWLWLLPMFSMGFVVVSAWTTLWLSGAWRPEPSWIDRVGMVLGFYWVVNGVLCMVIFFAGVA